MHLKLSSAKWRQFCPGGDKLIILGINCIVHSNFDIAMFKTKIFSWSPRNTGNIPLYLVYHNFTGAGANLAGPASFLVARGNWVIISFKHWYHDYMIFKNFLPFQKWHFKIPAVISDYCYSGFDVIAMSWSSPDTRSSATTMLNQKKNDVTSCWVFPVVLLKYQISYEHCFLYHNRKMLPGSVASCSVIRTWYFCW